MEGKIGLLKGKEVIFLDKRTKVNDLAIIDRWLEKYGAKVVVRLQSQCRIAHIYIEPITDDDVNIPSLALDLVEEFRCKIPISQEQMKKILIPPPPWHWDIKKEYHHSPGMDPLPMGNYDFSERRKVAMANQLIPPNYHNFKTEWSPLAKFG